MNSRTDVALILQGLSYKVRTNTSSNSFAFESFIPVFGTSTITYQQLVAMLQGHMRFIYVTSRRKLLEYNTIVQISVFDTSGTKQGN